MRLWALRAANTFLFVACCYLAAGIVRDFLAQALLPTHAEVIAPAAAPVAAARGWDDRQPILDRNLFGAKLGGERAEVVVVEDLEETKLPLKLLGTVAGEDEQVSNAAIQDTSIRKHQVVFVGDRLTNHPDVEVIAIERGRVILQNGPKREELLLHEDADKPAGPAVARRRTPRRNRARVRTSSNIGSRLRALSANGDDGEFPLPGARDPASLFSQARIVPKYDAGNMVGIQLNEIESGSLYEKIGIKSGDVITALNGIPIDSASASAKILTEFTEADAFRVEILGGNTIEVSSTDLEGLLGK
jgi:general secretion pathway protein C